MAPSLALLLSSLLPSLLWLAGLKLVAPPTALAAAILIAGESRPRVLSGGDGRFVLALLLVPLPFLSP